MENSCPSLEDRIRAQADPQQYERFLAHAADCPDCQARIDWVEEGVEALREGRKAYRPAFWPAAAAAGVLLALSAAWFLTRESSAPVPDSTLFSIPSGEQIPGGPGVYSAGPSQERLLTLPDSTRVRLEAGAVLQILPAGSDERMNASLETGSLEAEVPPGKGVFRISAGGGGVQVLGTRFWIKSFDLRNLAGKGENVPCLCAEVYEGRVHLQGDSRNLLLSAQERGVAVQGRIPVKQRLGGDWREALGTFAGFLRQSGTGFEVSPESREQAEWAAAILLGGRWGQRADLGDSSGDPPAVRQAKQLLREAGR